tara:strand:- start:2150 stop:2545 length:396 start_codon:yes stop_codon:yes gene_type:complete
MNEKQLEKAKNRIKEIELFLNNNRDYSKFDSSALFNERSELNFKIHKQNVSARFGSDKYYQAWQCYDFSEYIKNNGFNRYKASEIENIYFSKHSITINGSTDIKRFKTAKEMFAFVQGFNESIYQLKVKSA